jgi:uncharacterized protein YlaI
MCGKENKMIDINVKQIPVSVHVICEECLDEFDIPYKDFVMEHGEACNWIGETVFCHICGHLNKIDNWTFD